MPEIILVIVYTAFFSFLIFRFTFFSIPGFSYKHVLAVFYLKIIAGIFLYLVYTYYYTDRATADIFRYFDDSRIMFNALFYKPLDYIQMLTGIKNDSPHFDEYYRTMNNWYRQYESNIYNDSHTIIRINAFIRLFSFGYYNVHTVFFCFLSLIGLTALYRFFHHLIPSEPQGILFAVFLIPSVLFWGSGVLKEPVLIFGMGILIYSFSIFISNPRKIFHAFMILFSLILLFYTKFYILFSLVPLLISYLWVIKTGRRFTEWKYISVIIAYSIIGLNIWRFFPSFNFLQILADKQKDFINLALFMKSGSIIDIGILHPTVLSLLHNSPAAFFISLFRPFIFESSSPFFLIAGFENLIIILFAAISVIFIRTSAINRNLLCFCILFVIITFTLTGLITPVLGAIVRYKVPALPFLFIIFILLIDKEKFLKKFRLKK